MAGAHVVKITLNGQEKTVADACTVQDLLRQLGMAERRVAVELNQEIVPRSRHGAVHLRNNDRVEVVAAIGGG
jgi:sulfur carrier protein